MYKAGKQHVTLDIRWATAFVCLKIQYAFHCVAAENIGSKSTMIYYLILKVPILSDVCQVYLQCMINVCNPTNRKLRSRLLFIEAARNDYFVLLNLNCDLKCILYGVIKNHLRCVHKMLIANLIGSYQLWTECTQSTIWNRDLIIYFHRWRRCCIKDRRTKTQWFFEF